MYRVLVLRARDTYFEPGWGSGYPVALWRLRFEFDYRSRPHFSKFLYIASYNYVKSTIYLIGTIILYIFSMLATSAIETIKINAFVKKG